MRRLTLISLLVVAAAGAAGAVTGCSSELETGYKPKPLGATTEERKGYYAPAFSPEAEMARQGQAESLKVRRPTGY